MILRHHYLKKQLNINVVDKFKLQIITTYDFEMGIQYQ